MFGLAHDQEVLCLEFVVSFLWIEDAVGEYVAAGCQQALYRHARVPEGLARIADHLRVGHVGQLHLEFPAVACLQAERPG